jgi:hypothetical protein
MGSSAAVVGRFTPLVALNFMLASNLAGQVLANTASQLPASFWMMGGLC